MKRGRGCSGSAWAGSYRTTPASLSGSTSATGLRSGSAAGSSSSTPTAISTELSTPLSTCDMTWKAGSRPLAGLTAVVLRMLMRRILPRAARTWISVLDALATPGSTRPR